MKPEDAAQKLSLKGWVKNMDRMTEYRIDPFGVKRAVLVEATPKSICTGCEEDCETCSFSHEVKRLAAYEDTELEPETISKIRDIVLDISGDLDRLCELAQADGDGLCGIPPVKLHQKIFRVFNGKVYEEIVCSATWEPFTPRPRWKVWVMGSGLPYYWGDVLGETVFLTREEAEAALRREQYDE